jgi:hypothetical protein
MTVRVVADDNGDVLSDQTNADLYLSGSSAQGPAGPLCVATPTAR